MTDRDPRLKPWPLEFNNGAAVLQFEIGPMQNLVYLIIDPATRKAAWVDPQKDLRDPLAAIEKHGLVLESILLTHTHHDHVAGVPALLQLFPELSVFLHQRDAFRISHQLPSDARLAWLEDGDSIKLGSLTLQAWNLPGHSVGALNFQIPRPSGVGPLLLTGDTLFIRDCGRTDLPTGSTAQMFDSLQRYRQFPGNTVILPGHHYRDEWWSTLEQEWRESPPFQCRSASELEALP